MNFTGKMMTGALLLLACLMVPAKAEHQSGEQSGGQCSPLVWKENMKIKTLSGEEFVLPRLNGRWTLIIYFTSKTCMACLREKEEWIKLYKNHGREDLSLIGVLEKTEDEKTAEAFLKYLNLPFPVVYDKESAFQDRFRVPFHQTPFKVLVSGTGNIVYIGWANKTKTMQQRFFEDIEDLIFSAAANSSTDMAKGQSPAPRQERSEQPQ